MKREPQTLAQATTYMLLMIALAFFFGVTTLSVPGLGAVTAFLYPVPLAMIAFRRGLPWGLIGILVVTLLLTVLSDPVTAGLLSLQYGALGLFLGACFRRHLPPARVLVTAVLLAAGLSVLTLALTALAAGLSLGQMYNTYITLVKQVLEQSFAESAYQGVSLIQYKEAAIAAFTELLPALLIIYAMVVGAIGYLITVKRARHYDPEVPKLPGFSTWKLPWQLVWVFIIAIIVNFLSRNQGWTLAQQIAVNVMYVMYPLLIVCGLAFVYWLLRQLGPLGRMLTVFLAIILFNIFIYFLLVVAVVDPIFDLRSRLNKLFKRDQA